MYLFTIGILGVLVVAVTAWLNFVPLSEKLTTTLWLLLLITTLSFLCKSIYSNLLHANVLNYLYKVWNYIKRHTRVIGVILLLFVLIKSAFEPLYYLGGDDTRLFYLYPDLFYKNFASKIVSDNTFSNVGNFLPPPAVLSFTFLMWFLKSLLPFVNLQSLLYMMNLWGGVFFFYLLLSTILKNNSNYGKVIKILASLMYVFSIFNFYILFNSKLITIFLVAIFPLSMFLYIEGVKRKKLYYIFILSIMLTIFGVVSAAAVWFLAALLVFLPLIFYFLIQHKKTMILYTSILLISLFALNFHWLIFIFHTTLGNKSPDALNSIVSSGFLQENAEGVRGTTQINSLFYPLLNLYHRQIQINFNWSYLQIFQNWYMVVLPFNFVFIFLILTAGFLKKCASRISSLYVVSSFCFLIAVYLFTVNIGETAFGNIGIESFIWMVNNVPGFIVFRNMYDKFSYAMAFMFALMSAISLSILFEYFKSKKIKTFILVTFSFVILLNATPFFLNWFDKRPIWTTSNLYQNVTELNSDYKDLVEYVEKQEYRGRYLILPMSGGNVITIRDEHKPDHFYVGVSPLLILSGKNDYSGILSFGSRSNELSQAVREKDYQRVGKIFQQMNVSYIILNKDVPSEIESSYMYPEDLYYSQNDEFKAQFLGEKIKDFGFKYSIYTINASFANQKVFLSDIKGEAPDQMKEVTYTKVASHDFSVYINNLKETQTLTFLEDYDLSWKLILDDGDELSIPMERASYVYAMNWVLNPEYIKANFSPNNYTENPDGSISLALHIYFEPFKYYYPALIASGAIFSVLIGYIIWAWKKDKKNI